MLSRLAPVTSTAYDDDAKSSFAYIKRIFYEPTDHKHHQISFRVVLMKKDKQNL